ncbi:hypothetical protein [Methylocystis sp.]|uniref:hypothetical protein n=1 Tax=Methylocystis sp. TaxID=1911079 RepID=UPI003D0B093E
MSVEAAPCHLSNRSSVKRLSWRAFFLLEESLPDGKVITRVFAPEDAFSRLIGKSGRLAASDRSQPAALQTIFDGKWANDFFHG